MSDGDGGLPEGWAEAIGVDLFDFIRGVSYSKKEVRETPSADSIAVLRAGNLQDGEIVLDDLVHVPQDKVRDEQCLRLGDLVIAMSSGSSSVVGKVAVVRVDMPRVAFGAFCGLMRPRTPEVRHWLAEYFQTVEYRTFISRIAAGININNLRREHLQDLTIRLPPPPELRRLEVKIESLQERSSRARRALSEVRPLLEQFRQSVLQAAFSGLLTADWRAAHPDVEPASELLTRIRTERRHRWEQAELAKYEAKGRKPPKGWQEKYKEPEPVDESGLPELPNGWCWVTIDAIAKKVSDGVHKKPKYVENGVPFVTVKNLTAGPGISFEHIKYVTQEDHADFIRRTHPERGDILVTKDGTLGVIRLIDTDTAFSIFVSLALIKTALPDIAPFIARMLEAPQGQASMKATGSGLQHIHLIDLRATVVPLAPLEEQAEITRLLQELTEFATSVLGAVAKSESTLTQLDQSILAKAFRGELVPQDPNDEPASELLARIRRSREAQSATKSTRSTKKSSPPAKPTATTTVEQPAQDPPDLPEFNGTAHRKTAPPKPAPHEYATDEVMAHFRAACWGTGEQTETELLRAVAERLGYTRLGKNIHAELKNHLRAAIRRRIVERDGDTVKCVTSIFRNYDDDFLLKCLRSAMTLGYEYEREDVIHNVAQHLGYSHATEAIRTRMKSLFNTAIRRGLLGHNGKWIWREE